LEDQSANLWNQSANLNDSSADLNAQSANLWNQSDNLWAKSKKMQDAFKQMPMQNVFSPSAASSSQPMTKLNDLMKTYAARAMSQIKEHSTPLTGLTMDSTVEDYIKQIPQYTAPAGKKELVWTILAVPQIVNGL
jgi:hypothetical protein